MEEKTGKYLEDNAKVIKLADDLSQLIINKVLAKDMSMKEALNAISLTQALLVSRTMPEERYIKQIDKSEPLAVELSKYVRDTISDGSYNVVDIIIAFGISLDYIIRNLEDE